MAEFPTYEEMAKNVAEKALDDLLYNGKSIREWMQIIASEDCISRSKAIKALEYDLSIEADGGFDKYRTVIKDLLNAIYNTQKKAIEALPSVQPINPNIKALGKELRTFRGGIKDEKVLTGFNMAIALCNKHLADMRGTESEDK